MRDKRLYVIAANNGLVKIGMSQNPRRRVSQFGRPHWGLKLIWMSEPRKDAERLEAAVHLALKKYFELWEWFYVKPQTAVRAARRIIRLADAGRILPVWRIAYRGSCAPPAGGVRGMFPVTAGLPHQPSPKPSVRVLPDLSQGRA